MEVLKKVLTLEDYIRQEVPRHQWVWWIVHFLEALDDGDEESEEFLRDVARVIQQRLEEGRW